MGDRITKLATQYGTGNERSNLIEIKKKNHYWATGIDNGLTYG